MAISLRGLFAGAVMVGILGSGSTVASAVTATTKASSKTPGSTTTTAPPATLPGLTTVPPTGSPTAAGVTTTTLASGQIPTPAKVTVVAAVKGKSIKVYDQPSAKSKFITMDNKTNFSGRHVFVVIDSNGEWVRAQIPLRPNGRIGFLRATDVLLYQHDYAIDVSLSTKKLVLYKAGTAILTETVAIGQTKYPTPTGVFFIRELARPRNPGGAYGPYAFGLSGYSNVLTKFGRGDGQIGIHGTNEPKQLGGAVSHGCVRLSNAAITKLAKLLPQGVPVTIHA